MIFTRLRIFNLFSYHEAELDLAPRGTPPRPIVVVRARNGQGKTNLLCCLKLALGGVTDHLRDTAGAGSGGGASGPGALSEAGRKVRHNEYVWGRRDQGWEGILNRQVLKRMGDRAQYGVQLTLREGGDEITVDRFWPAAQPGGGGYTGTLLVRINGHRQGTDQDAQDLLHSLCPEASIPYYVFDGELVQRVGAFSGDSLETDVYRLLELDLLDRLRLELTGAAESWALEAATREVKQRVTELENQLRSLATEQEGLDEDEQKARDLLDRAEKALRRARARSEEVATTGPQGREALEAKVSEAESGLKERLDRLYNEQLPLAPLIFSPDLVQQARARVERELREAQRPDAFAEVREVVAGLPAEIASPSLGAQLGLSGAGRQQLEDHTRRVLEVKFPPPRPPPPGTWLGLSPATVRRVQRDLDRYGDSTRANTAREDLAALASAQRELRRLRQALADSPDHSAQRRREIQEAIEEVERWTVARNNASKQLGDVRERRQALGQQRAQVEGRLDTERADLLNRERAGTPAALAHGAAAFVEWFADHAVQARRAQVNEALNRHFAELFTSSAQIGRLELDERFVLRLHTPDGRRVEAHNISAGMRQLVSTALLWALQGAGGRRVPVAIDTPIARLDREHQERILFHYLPRAADQVLLLPTDAELDEGRLRRLAPHISHGYTLHNPTGEHTEVGPLGIPGAGP